MNSDGSWTIIEPKSSLFNLRLKEIWRYRDLIRMSVRRDIVTVYKQTILGPFWYLITPLATTLIYTFVFGKIAKIPTGNVPHFLFYLAGVTIWSYFTTCFAGTSNVFRANQSVFSKVYFPRMVVPISVVISNFIKLIIKLFLFVAFLFYYYFQGAAIKPNLIILLLPFLFIITAIIAIGLGIIASSLNTKYRDVGVLLSFSVGLLMYATPIIYSINDVPSQYKQFILLNPMTGIVYTFKYAFFGGEYFHWNYLIYSTVFALVFLFVGMVIFNRVEKNFIDTI